MQVPVHIDAAEGPFNRIDCAVLVTIQFLKVVMRQIGGLRIWHPLVVRMRERIIALGIFEHPIVHEVRPGLHNGFGHDFSVSLDL